jgi:hypothetical protein
VQKGTHCDLGRIVAAVDGHPLASVTSAAASLRTAVAEFSGSKESCTAVSECIGYGFPSLQRQTLVLNLKALQDYGR